MLQEGQSRRCVGQTLLAMDSSVWDVGKCEWEKGLAFAAQTPTSNFANLKISNPNLPGAVAATKKSRNFTGRLPAVTTKTPSYLAPLLNASEVIFSAHAFNFLNKALGVFVALL